MSVQHGQLGIHPPGALGVGFFVHARGDCFIGRGGDGITDPLKEAGGLKLEEHGRVRRVSLRDRIFGNLLEADALDHMPEVLMVCCNPNQLALMTGEMTRFVENLAGRERLKTLDDIRANVPILLALPNGILSEQMLQAYEEQLHESLVMNRLPGVSEEMVDALLQRVVRGVSLQAGGRRGFGADTVYILEAKGSLVFAGGGEEERRRVEAVLTAHEFPFKHAHGVPGTRIEFDKAMISAILNVGGLIHMVQPNGALTDLRMGDLCNDPTKVEFIERVTRAVFDVGKAAGAYPDDAVYEQIWEGHRNTILSFAGHVTSSVKQFRDALAAGLDGVTLFANEEWILTPLGRYAANAGMREEEQLFKSLRRQVQEAMARAIRYRDENPQDSHSRASHMKLFAQRHISIELFESGPKDVAVVGTMLDSDHLIKLELGVYLPDEQITHSKLEMIRVPFPVCREVESVAERLVGLRIQRGVLGEIVRRVGGRVGCSHIKELATNIVYFVASNLVVRRTGIDPMSTDYSTKPPDERFALTKGLLRDSCLAYCQSTAQGLDERIGIRRIGEEHSHPQPLGDYEESLGVLLRERAERFGDKTMLRFRRDGNIRTISFAEFGRSVFRIAANLIDTGIRPGDRVAMLSENGPEMFMIEMAAMSIGAVSVPIFAGYPKKQVAYVLEHARPRFLVVSGKHQLDKIERDRHRSIKHWFCMDFDDGAKKWGALDVASLMTDAKTPADKVQERVDTIRRDTRCMVMYTSGTTGPPKGVCLRHRNLISQQRAISLLWDVDEHDATLSYLPWHHSFGGLFERMLTLYSGCEMCLDDSRGRDIDRMIENWKAYKPSMFFSVPRVHDQLITRCRDHAEATEVVFGGRLRFVFTAGAPLPAHVEAAYRAHDIPVLEGWGLTETSPCVTMTTRDRSWQSGCVGFPIPGVTVRIDSDQEILVKGPNVMEGYLDDAEATTHVIDKDGWFHTGDLGEFTSDGLRIFGRMDGAFKLTTGEKVHPQKIENVLVNESPYISLAMVLGSGKDFVAAIIWPNFSNLDQWAKEQKISADRLVDQPAVRALFATELRRLNMLIDVKYQRVRRAMLADHEPSLADAELTPSGKLVRTAVLNRYSETIAAMFSEHPSEEVIETQHRELQRT